MKTRLHRWCQNHGANDHQATTLTDSVFAKYSEAHRHYHHLEHICSSLTHLDQLGWTDDLLEGAIWFHDVIYEDYRHAIRREYQHIPEKDFKRGRAVILERFLAGKIYLSTEFQHLEPSAKQNLAKELADLTDH